jgi:hypothetical protein
VRWLWGCSGPGPDIGDGCSITVIRCTEFSPVEPPVPVLRAYTWAMRLAQARSSTVLRGAMPYVSALVWMALISLGSYSNATPVSDNGKAKSAQKQVHLLADIDRLIGDAKCTSDQQCRVAGIGALSCGGPEYYQAWSTALTDERALTKLLNAYASERQRINQANGLMSTCEVRPVPAIRCERSNETSAKCSLSGLASDLR